MLRTYLANAVALLIGACLPAVAAAQADRQLGSYAEVEGRTIKSLSEEEVADLLAGRGMGYGLAAELNGYPGPLHVVEHADGLRLSPDQRTRARALYRAMRAEAVPLGERLVRQEADLDRLFATGAADPVSIGAAAGAIAATEGALRATHLRYHLATRDLLTPEQVRRYAELRGYAGGRRGGQHGHHGHAR